MLTPGLKIGASLALVFTLGSLALMGDLPWWEPLGVMVVLLVAVWVS